MALRMVAISFDAHDPAGLAVFWAGVLGREIVVEATGALLLGDDIQVGLRFVEAATERSGPNRLHLHLTSSTLEDQRHTVETALQLGGRHIDVGQLPEEGHVVLADPGGNEFCVIEPGNNFLAGCGFLGEVACAGTREVGLFLARRTRVAARVGPRRGDRCPVPPGRYQSLTGGGPPVAPKSGRNRQRLDLATPDVAAEVERLIALGAAELGDRDGGVELADPDGNEFSVNPG